MNLIHDHPITADIAQGLSLSNACQRIFPRTQVYGKSVSTGALQQSVFTALINNVLTLDKLRPKSFVVADTIQNDFDNVDDQIAELREKLESLHTIIAKIGDAIESGDASSTLRARLAQRKSKELELIGQIAVLEAKRFQALKLPDFSDETLDVRFRELRETIIGEDVQVARKAPHGFVGKIVVKQKTATLYYRFPFQELGRLGMVPHWAFGPDLYFQPKTQWIDLSLLSTMTQQCRTIPYL